MSAPARWECAVCGHRWTLLPARKFVAFILQISSGACPACGAGSRQQLFRGSDVTPTAPDYRLPATGSAEGRPS